MMEKFRFLKEHNSTQRSPITFPFREETLKIVSKNQAFSVFLLLCRLTEKKVAGKACEKHFLVIGEVCGKSNFERIVLAQDAVHPDKTGIVAKLLSRASAH